MRKPLLILRAFAFALTVLVAGDALGFDPQLAITPKLGSVWRLQPDPGRQAKQAVVPFRWAVYKNQTTGDLLSFATLSGESVTNLRLEKYADTAFEIFPDGNPVWTKTDSSGRIESLAVDLIRDHDGRSTGGSILSYCFVANPQKESTLMAHGRAWVDGDTIVFVQHTSQRPIGSGLVVDTIRELREVDAGPARQDGG